MPRKFAMTVKEVKEALEFANDDAEVIFVCSYGDYHDTQQALGVRDATELTMTLQKTAYSRSGYAMPHGEDSDEAYEGPDCKPYMVFSMDGVW